MSMTHSGGMILMWKIVPVSLFFTTDPTYRSKNKVLGFRVFLTLFFETPLHMGGFCPQQELCTIYFMIQVSWSCQALAVCIT